MKLKDKIIDILKQCYDPEIPIDLWNLGLIYDITIKDDGIEINNFIGINDFENGEKWTSLMSKLKDEIIKMI